MLTLTRRTAAILVAVTDAVVAPEDALGLPPVERTDAVAAFDRWLAAGTKLNATALKAGLVVLDLAPFALGPRRATMRRLGRTERMQVVAKLDRLPQLRNLLDAIGSAAQLAYYGDLEVGRMIGFDPERIVLRAKALRTSEGRP